MGCDIIIGTIGRLLHFISKKFISLTHVKYVILDECDKLLEDQNSIETILYHDSMPSNSRKNVLMFSATLPAKSLAERYLNNYVFLSEEENMGGVCPRIVQRFYTVLPSERQMKLLELLKSSDAMSTLIFVNSSKNTESVSQFLNESGIPCTNLYSGLPVDARLENLENFQRGIFGVLVATDVASRGLGEYGMLD
jgi:superfamily II DNA/RNA helicase